MTKLSLQVRFHGVANGLPELATGQIYRQGEHFTAQSSEEDIKMYLDGIIERAIYTNNDDDKIALLAMNNEIKGGVNGFNLLGSELVSAS